MPTCSTCKQIVDSNAAFCPNCGRPEPGKLGFFGWIVLIILILFALSFCSSSKKNSSPQDSPPQPVATESETAPPPEDIPQSSQTIQPESVPSAQTTYAPENTPSPAETTPIATMPDSTDANPEPLPPKYHFEADLQDANGDKRHVRLDAYSEDEARRVIKTLGNPEILTLERVE